MTKKLAVTSEELRIIDHLKATCCINCNGSVRVLVSFLVSTVFLRQEVVSVCFFIIGDFHFLWECMRAVFGALWGSELDKGSLCHLKDLCGRRHASNDVRVFYVCDELLFHAFEAHPLAAVTSYLQMSSPSSEVLVCKEKNLKCLRETAEAIMYKTVLPEDPPSDLTKVDHLYQMHRRILYMGFLCHQLRDAIRKENGPKIISFWRYWLIIILGARCKNYSVEAANLLANLKADWLKSIAFIHTHNRTVNMSGRSDGGKPVDQLIEHYNLYGYSLFSLLF